MTAIVALGLRVLLAGVLYTFLGLAVYILWQEIRQQGAILSSQKRSSIYIVTQVDNGKEFKYHFWQTEITIGRNSNCDICPSDESLSANHACISYHHTQWWLEDTGSTNGTFLNNDKVTVPTVIIADDQFKCGNTLFTIRIDPREENNPHDNTN